MDNFYDKCPPMMSDGGRHLGDFKTATRRNEMIKHINNITCENDYRLFLQQNGKTIEDNVYAYHTKNNSCHMNSCVHNYPTRVDMQQMAEELKAYNALGATNFAPTEGTGCPKWKDFRLTCRK